MAVASEDYIWLSRHHLSDRWIWYISDQICLQVHLLNQQQQGIDTDTVQIACHSLYLTIVDDNSDLVVSINDLLLHVGLDQQSMQCHWRSGKDFATGWVVDLTYNCEPKNTNLKEILPHLRLYPSDGNKNRLQLYPGCQPWRNMAYTRCNMFPIF